MPQTAVTDLPATYLGSFAEAPGYLNFASYGPPSRDVARIVARLTEMAMAGEVGASDRLHEEDLRARRAFARLGGFDVDRVTLVPATSYGLFQLAFGVAGGSVLVSSGEFPANLYPWLRADAAGLSKIRLMGGPGFHVTPQAVADALTPDTAAVTVSAVDFRTGFRADLAGIRAAIGPDRLLLVDGIQGFGAADIDWSAADAVVMGAQKWVRGGWGAGALAFSEAGMEAIRPVLGGWTGVAEPSNYDGVEHPLRPDALRYTISNLSPMATGAFATALELLETATVAAVAARISARAEELIGLLDDAGIQLLSPRNRAERAGIVVAGIAAERAPEAHAALAAAGISATLHGADRIRFSVHATTTPAPLAEAAGILGTFA
jgi:selenocysteine lyase/cysteine desulfurase